MPTGRGDDPVPVPGAGRRRPFGSRAGVPVAAGLAAATGLVVRRGDPAADGIDQAAASAG